MKNFTFLLLSTFVFFSCKNNLNEKNAYHVKNEKLVQQYFEYFNAHNWSKMANMYSKTSAFKDPSLGQGIVLQTRQAIVDKYTELNKLFSDLHDSIIQTYPSGANEIIVEFISTGTAPDNSKFKLPICTIFTIKNGLITKDFTYYDNFDGENGKN